MAEAVSGTASRDRLLQAAIEHFAEAGVSNQSLRGLAEAIGTSHRMLIYHFGSREGLLAAVVDAVEQQQRATLEALTAASAAGSPRQQGERFWAMVVEPALKYGPLFFELSAHAMQGQPHAAALQQSLVDPWLEPLTRLLVRGGHPPARARRHARLALAVARGLLFDLLLTGRRRDVDSAMRLFTDLVEADLSQPRGSSRTTRHE